MDKRNMYKIFEEEREKENKQQINKEESLDVVFISRILMKYSDYYHPLTCDDVIIYMKKYDIEVFERKTEKNLLKIKELEKIHDLEEKEKALKSEEVKEKENKRKKIERILDTLVYRYPKGVFKRKDGDIGKTGKPIRKWYYDAECDKYSHDFATRESLSETEIQFLADVVASSNILNKNSSWGLIEKLLNKIDMDEKERNKVRSFYKKETWEKNINEEFFEKKLFLEDNLDMVIEFDYHQAPGDKAVERVVATACNVGYQEDKFVLWAKQGDKERMFIIEYMSNVEVLGEAEFDEEYEDFLDRVMEFEYDTEDITKEISLDSFFQNMSIIKRSIKEKCGLSFKYLSYKINNNKITLIGKDEIVLPHSFVFTDEKYYLIAAKADENEIEHYRVDLMSEVKVLDQRIKLTDYVETLFEGLKRENEVKGHPFMMTGADRPITFLVNESALDRVIDAFGSKIQFRNANTQKYIKRNPTKEYPNDNHSISECRRENLIEIRVRTTEEEAFRWALANADAVELVGPQELRDRLRRMVEPIRRSYEKTLADRAQEEVDKIYRGSTFNIWNHCDQTVAAEVHKILKNKGDLDAVRRIVIMGVKDNSKNELDYLKDFQSTYWLKIEHSYVNTIEWSRDLNNIRVLQIDDTLIDDISAVCNNKTLDSVRITNSPIKDVSVLSDQMNIKNLIIKNTDVEDLSFVEKMPHLNYFAVTGCPIKDYSFLLKMHPLQTLEITRDAIEQIDIERLKQHHPNANILVKERIINRPNKYMIFQK